MVEIRMLRDFLDWWLNTLRQRLSFVGGGAVTPSIILRKTGIETKDGDKTVLLAHEEVSQLDPALPKLVPALALDSSRYVLRPLSQARLPASRARAMAQFDLGSSTPFAPEDVHCFVVEPNAGQNVPSTAYAIVKNSVTDPVFRQLQARGRTVGEVQLLQSDETSPPLGKLSTADVNALNGGRGWRSRAETFALASLPVLAILSALHLQWTYASAETNVAGRLPELEAKARSVRQELNRRAALADEIKALRREIASQRPMVEVWEEISRVLPDSAYLTDFTIDGGNVTLTGFALSASSIIAPLEGSQMFQGAEFASPVIKVPGREGERFEVKMNVVERLP